MPYGDGIADICPSMKRAWGCRDVRSKRTYSLKIWFLGDTRSAEELAVFTNMAPERLCLGSGLRVEENFTPIFPGERGPLFAASGKLLHLPCVLLAHRLLKRVD